MVASSIGSAASSLAATIRAEAGPHIAFAWVNPEGTAFALQAPVTVKRKADPEHKWFTLQFPVYANSETSRLLAASANNIKRKHPKALCYTVSYRFYAPSWLPVDLGGGTL